ncbi:type II toxin-antitoxin system HicB family antitoxin [Nocardia sp. BMG111209]|uniref:type II toxin-antitoxin system HicB family antitoxin n=1 Tax=Nocardia sp. BMG111209 TaxID=1160137 RepID=UPI0003770516|nr:type II toxin-antitoxin system HicB family antitoxin [Nocardia sp. BMG111209]
MNDVDRTYLVVVTREGKNWLADVPELSGAHTFSRSLSGLEQSVREVIVLTADLPEENLPELRLDWAFDTGDRLIDATALTVRKIRARADTLAAEAAQRTADAVRLLTEHGMGVRDTAMILGISPQRVSQITGHRG